MRSLPNRRYRPQAPRLYSASGSSLATNEWSGEIVLLVSHLLCRDHCRPQQGLQTKSATRLIYSVGVDSITEQNHLYGAEYNCKIQQQRSILNIPHVEH